MMMVAVAAARPVDVAVILWGVVERGRRLLCRSGLLFGRHEGSKDEKARRAPRSRLTPGLAATSLALCGFVAPLKPYAEQPEERRCPAIGAFVEAFGSQRLKGTMRFLACDEIVDPPESPWLAATLSYTYSNMTRVLQLCVRQTTQELDVALSGTGGPCVDEYLARYAAEPADVAVEADPGLRDLKRELVAWLGQ
jgi:hypothetical protein